MFIFFSPLISSPFPPFLQQHSLRRHLKTLVSPLVQERDDILETTLDLPEPRVLINSLSSNNKSSSFRPFTLFSTPPVSPPSAD
jgi:hypothetical protein